MLTIAITALLVLVLAFLIRDRINNRFSDVNDFLPSDDYMSKSMIPSKARRRLIRRGVQVPSLAKHRRSATLLVIPSMLGFSLGLKLVGGSWILGGILGASVPFIVVIQLQLNYEKKYREDARRAFEFARSIFDGGGSIEVWVEKVIPRLNGPMHSEFKQGLANYRQGMGITVFLEYMANTSPDPYVQYVFSTLLKYYRGGGDLKAFVDTVLGDLQLQRKHAREMAQLRKSGRQMILFICGFGLFMYLLFYDSLQEVMHNHPWAVVFFIIYVLGLICLVWVADKVTRSKVV